MGDINLMNPENEQLIKFWVFRILINLGGHRKFIEKHGYEDDDLAYFLGVVDQDIRYCRHIDDFSYKTGYLVLTNKFEAFKKNASGYPALNGDLQQNIEVLAEIICLNAVDKKILAFAILLSSDSLLEEAVEYLGSMNFRKLSRCLAVIIDEPYDAVIRSIGESGSLTKARLVNVTSGSFNSNLDQVLQLMSDEFASNMMMPLASPIDLLANVVHKCSAPELCLTDYSHMGNELSLMSTFFKESNAKGLGGNVLIYGPPGTGKSQLARVISKHHSASLFEVTRENDDSGPISADSRLASFLISQRIFEGTNTFLLFDEIEDVFEVSAWSKNTPKKGWINRVLEENKVPTFWLTNSIDCIDPAIIRRFDMVVELPIPPLSSRKKITETLCEGMVSKDIAETIACSPDLSPAVLRRCLNVLSETSDGMSQDEKDKSLQQLIDGVLRAQGHRLLPAKKDKLIPEYYDPTLINANIDLINLADCLGESKTGRICLYGPSGTGKTVFAKWLSTKLGLPLNVKRASDLVSMYVGQTESNIADAFTEAAREGAILLIDEVDSFLQDRKGAYRSWEVSAVNEMLTQMECYEGIFIASTNMMDNMDEASMRRFDVKAKFDYLNQEQSWRLFNTVITSLGLRSRPEIKRRLHSLSALTLGDYNVLLRRNKLLPVNSADELIDRLSNECSFRAKEGMSRPIGFINTSRENNVK